MDRLCVRGAKGWSIADLVYCGLFAWKCIESRKFPVQAISYCLAAVGHHLWSIRRDKLLLSRFKIRSNYCPFRNLIGM